MSVFFMDTIDIINTTFDDNGVGTESEELNVSARVEDFNGLIIDSKGQETYSDMIIFFDPSKIINNESKVRIKKKYGETYSDPIKKWKVLKSPIIHGFNAHHRELYV